MRVVGEPLVCEGVEVGGQRYLGGARGAHGTTPLDGHKTAIGHQLAEPVVGEPMGVRAVEQAQIGVGHCAVEKGHSNIGMTEVG